MTTGDPEWSGPPPSPPGPPGAPGSPGGFQPPPPPYYYYPGAPAPATEGMAIAALVLAIASFVFFQPITAIVALVLANSSNKRIQESQGRLTGETMNKASIIVSWVNIGIFAVLLLILIIVIVAAVASSN